VTADDATRGSPAPVSLSAPAIIAVRAALIAVPLLCAGHAIAHPDSVLVGGVAWLVAITASLAGYGRVAARLVRIEVDAGMRLAWGTALYLVAAGCLLAAGWLDQRALVGLLVAGGIAYVVRQLTVPATTLAGAARALTAARAQPRVAAFLGVIALVTAFNVAAAVARQDGNVYDDDIAYTPMVKRLLDTGDLVEPFSFRRISAYGGQTVLEALGAVRGTLANIYLLDGGFCQLLVMVLLLGLLRSRPAAAGEPAEPVDAFVAGLALLVVVLLPDTSINTASYWSGVALFLALYRTALLTTANGDHRRTFAAIGVIGGALCALRQNYLPVAALFVLVVLVTRLGSSPRARLRAELPHWLAALAGAVLAIAPYCVATWRSNDTFLYPLFDGTFNPDIQMRPVLFSAWQEAQFFIKVILEPDPYRSTLVLLPVLVLARDRRPGRPLAALTLASAVGFVLLVHSFSLSDARNLWRYSFGFSLPLILVLVIEGGGAGLRAAPRPRPVEVALLGRLVIVSSLLVQLAVSGRAVAKEYDGLIASLATAAGSRVVGSTATQRAYHDLQAAAPAGPTIAVMLDEPAHLDFARNRIINLDLPGFASYRPGMPFFQGAAAVVDYFRHHDIRYLAFVRGDVSRYMYRRDYWVQRLFWDTELWRIMGAYTVDCIESFATIAAEHTVLFERDGLVLVDLGGRP
jgi:hypothetical protein